MVTNGSIRMCCKVIEELVAGGKDRFSAFGLGQCDGAERCSQCGTACTAIIDKGTNNVLVVIDSIGGSGVIVSNCMGCCTFSPYRMGVAWYGERCGFRVSGCWYLLQFLWTHPGKDRLTCFIIAKRVLTDPVWIYCLQSQLITQ